MLMISLFMDPFVDRVQNTMSLVCHLQLTFSLYVGLLLKVGTVNQQDSEVVMTIIIACSACIVLVPMLEMLMYIQELFSGASRDGGRMSDRV